MNTSTSLSPFQTLSPAPPWGRRDVLVLDVPPAPRRASLLVTTGRAWRRAVRRLHEFAPAPQTMHESLGLRRAS